VASARELLEQADALMRRNRSPLMDDIPVLTDSVPVTPVGRPAARLRPLPPQVSSDTIPVLTQAIEAPPVTAPPAAPAPAAVVEEGEPSDWLQTGGAEPSVIGDAPDSIAMVPAYAEVREEIEVEAPPEVEESFDAELEERARGDAPRPEFMLPAHDSITAQSHLPAAQAPAPIEDAQPLPPPELLPQWESDTVIEEPSDEEPASLDAEPRLEAEPVVHEAVLEQPAPDAGPEDSTMTPEMPAPSEPVVEAGPSAEEREAAEDARWDSMAEEIRMQVLQRIDLFTDTGLRDQLGARLQPIVDRASADLVATINQHVGELLRAYVAEAIEREIENWKRSN
jgi:hypothetical protein